MAGSACGDVSGKCRNCEVPGKRTCESNQPGVCRTSRSSWAGQEG